jgi:hypothetical protein
MILLGFKKLTVGSKTFTLADEGVTFYAKQLGISDDFCGGSIKKFRKTKYGIFLCLNKRDDILFLGYTEESLTDEGRALLGMEPLPDAIKASREKLIEQAKALGIKGVLQNMKDETLLKKIKEVQGTKE